MPRANIPYILHFNPSYWYCMSKDTVFLFLVIDEKIFNGLFHYPILDPLLVSTYGRRGEVWLQVYKSLQSMARFFLVSKYGGRRGGGVGFMCTSPYNPWIDPLLVYKSSHHSNRPYKVLFNLAEQFYWRRLTHDKFNNNV